MPMYWTFIVMLYLALIIGAWQLMRRSRREHEAEVRLLKQEIARLRGKISLMSGSPEADTPVSAKELFLKDVQTHINDALDEGAVSVEALSARMNLGTQTFRRRLQNAAGMSPKEYILSIQMQRAAHLLLQREEISVQEIARRSGFEDASSFGHAFKRLYGCSPSQYREELIETNNKL